MAKAAALRQSNWVKEKELVGEKLTRWRLIIGLGLLAIIVVLVYTQFTIFVVQPIGAVPEGRTLIMRRTGKLKFIDSADSVCEREMGGVSLLCRGVVMGSVAGGDRILARLPYSETLYSISTDGKHYNR